MSVDVFSSRIAVVIPLRNRAEHLHAFIPYMEKFIESQHVQPHFLVVNQLGSKPFNRGVLLNIGFLQVEETFETVCFHDVDLLALDACCNYEPSSITTHMAGRLEQYNHRLPYPTYCGGVIKFPRDVFRAINGFSNDYYGWGREDDDLYLRMLIRSQPLARTPGLYTSLPHPLSSRLYLASNTIRLKTAIAKAKEGSNCRLELECMDHLCAGIDLSTSSNLPVDEGLSSLRFSKVLDAPLWRATNFPSSISTRHRLLCVYI